MATINDLPYELLYHIIFLMLQSSSGTEDLARIISVCRRFLLFAEDACILQIVNFDIDMEIKNFYQYQHVNSLLVKCSAAGNVAAQFLLGKVIMVSSSQLFLREWQKAKRDFHPCDFETLSDLSYTLGTNPAQNRKVGSFMTYFSPAQVSTSESSPKRLVHYELVKLFLLKGDHHDFIEMGVFLKYCIMYLHGVAKEYLSLVAFINLLVQRALKVRSMEKLANTEGTHVDYFKGFREYIEGEIRSIYNFVEDPPINRAASGNFGDKSAMEYYFLFEIYRSKCRTEGMYWKEAIYDADFVEALREEVNNKLDEAYADFSYVRAATIDHFEEKFG